MSYRAAFAVLAAILIAPAIYAQDTLIFSREGDVYHGQVLESDAETCTVKIVIDGKESTHKVKAERFDPHFFYQVRDKALGDDVAGRIELAKWAAANGLFSRAKAQMDQCRALDPKAVEEFMKTEFPKIKEGLAAKLMDAANHAFKVGSTTNAKKYASAILTKLQGTSKDAEAEALLTKVQEKIDADQEKKRAQRRKSQATDEKVEANQAAAAREAALGPVEKAIDDAEAANHRGLTGKNISKQKAGFEQAASKYKHAMSLCASHAKSTKDADVLKALEEMSETAKQGAVQAYLNLANAYASRGNYKKGTEYCNQALAVDPNNAEAKAARATISTTTSGWNRRRGRR